MYILCLRWGSNPQNPLKGCPIPNRMRIPVSPRRRKLKNLKNSRSRSVSKKSKYEELISVPELQDKSFGDAVSGVLGFKKPLNINAVDVAQYILDKQGEMPAMRLQRLVYYCQAWSLIWDEKPLYKDEIQAWASGPIVPSLYKEHEGTFILENFDRANPNKLGELEIETVDAVLDYYSDKETRWLSDLSKKEKPWKDARGNLGPTERCQSVITTKAMQDYYSNVNN